MKSSASKSNVKREQKTALFLREISQLIQRLSLDELDLSKIFVTKVKLSKDYSICYVYLSTYTDEKEDFEKALEILKLYKPSLRKALAKLIPGRYVANLRFLYDTSKEKERRITKLLEQISEEEKYQDE
ncbi:30S ribosome-binding factor RbfA [Candidatus Dependentiae bacterium]|nr:30S ribosome-binding factor RbfA [Candidatus Dependentiae bacterium]